MPGNAGLGTSGSGGASLVQAGARGVFENALAGHRLAVRHGRLGFLAREILREIPSVMRNL